jgi:hypothetical protein
VYDCASTQRLVGSRSSWFVPAIPVRSLRMSTHVCGPALAVRTSRHDCFAWWSSNARASRSCHRAKRPAFYRCYCKQLEAKSTALCPTDYQNHHSNAPTARSSGWSPFDASRATIAKSRKTSRQSVRRHEVLSAILGRTSRQPLPCAPLRKSIPASRGARVKCHSIMSRYASTGPCRVWSDKRAWCRIAHA